MAGFVLKNTLSDNGGVTRGVCKMDGQSNLTEVVETKNIVKTENGAEMDGVYSSITEVLIYIIEPRIPCNDVFLSVGLLNRTLSVHEFC